MPSGSCACGKIQISYTAEPANKVVCHCRDCQRSSGSAFSINNIVASEDFKVSGNTKVWEHTADSGKPVRNYFCDNCGTTLWTENGILEGKKIVKAGVLDKEELENAKPKVELYASGRVGWVPAVENADQKPQMY